MAPPTAPPVSQFIPFSVPNPTMPSNMVPLTLAQSLNISLAESPRTSGVRALLGIAKSAKAQALVMPNPGFYMANSVANSYYYGASIPIEPPWKLVFRLLVAKRQIEQAQVDIERQLWLFRGDVRRNYANLVMAEETTAVRQRLLELTKRIWNSSKLQFEAGNVPGLDARRAKLAYIQAKMDYEQAEIITHQSQAQVNIILGRPDDTPIKVPPLPVSYLPTRQDSSHATQQPSQSPLPTQDLIAELKPALETSASTGGATASDLIPDFNKPLPAIDKLVQLSKQNRPELKSARAAILTNKANLKNAYGNAIPTPRFVVGSQYQTGTDVTKPFFQAYVDAPIFNFNQGEIARFKATSKWLDLDLLSQENQINGQVSLAYHRVLAARKRLQMFLQEALPEAESVAEISQKGYQIGQTDLNTLLDAQRANITVKSQYLDSVLAYQLAMNDLEQAVGVPLE